METPPFIYHFTPISQWEKGKAENNYLPEDFEKEGFIHCSFKNQVDKSFNKHADKSKEHVLLKIDTKLLTSKLVLENTSGGTELYPHIYGTINNKAVIQELTIELGEDGKSNFPFE